MSPQTVLNDEEKESFHYPTARVQKGHLNEKGFGQHETRRSKMSILDKFHSSLNQLYTGVC